MMTFAELESHRRTVETPSGPISYLDVGEGPVAVFVHGVGTNAYLWRKVVAGVSDERRCVSIDLPLHGQSPAHPDQDFSISALARLLHEVCDVLELTAVDLVANDTGGAVAQVFAARHAERVRSLTLTNCDVHDNLPPEAFRPTVELARQGQLAPLAAQIIEKPELARQGPLGAGYEHPDMLSDELIQAYLGPVFGTPAAAQQFERCLTALDAADVVAVEAQLRELTAPTLIVWGTGDEFFETSWAYWLRDTIPGVTEVVEVPGAKLFFPDERPDDLIPHLRRHWTAQADNLMTEQCIPLANVFTLGARDLPAQRRFYRRLGWPQIVDDDDFAVFELRGAVVALFGLERLAADGQAEPEPGRGGVRFTIGLMVDTAAEVDRLTDRFQRSGGRITKDPVDAEFFEGRSAYVADPEGNYFEIAWAGPDNPIVAAARRAARPATPVDH